MSPEALQPDKYLETMTELSRNLMWQYGEVFLSTDQQIELYGEGVDLTIEDSRAKRPDSLPIADVSFCNHTAYITFVQEDYEYVLDVICKPDKLNGHKAASFYIGAGIAPAVLHEFLARNRNYGMIDNVYSHLYRMPPKDNLKERMMISQGTSKHLPKFVYALFENMMTSDEKRIVRINLLRYGIGSLFRILETTNKDWELWQRDDKDRAGYILNFRDACTSEMVDMLRAQHRLDVITKSLGKSAHWQSQTFYDRVPEILIAGSMPMTAEEIDEINQLLEMDGEQ